MLVESPLYCRAYAFAIVALAVGPRRAYVLWSAHFSRNFRALTLSIILSSSQKDHDQMNVPSFAMNLDPAVLRRLRASPEIFNQIATWSGPELALQDRLRTAFSADLVRGALTLVELRRRAAVKFSRAAGMWFDRVGLEQSTAEAVARHKAQRFQGRGRVWDLCCGIGGDAIQLAGRAAKRSLRWTAMRRPVSARNGTRRPMKSLTA